MKNVGHISPYNGAFNHTVLYLWEVPNAVPIATMKVVLNPWY